MNAIRRYLLCVNALLLLWGPVAANTVFEIAPDTVYEGKWPDTLRIVNLTGDSIRLDTVYMSFDTNQCIDCFYISIGCFVGRNDPAYHALCGSYGSEAWCSLKERRNLFHIPPADTIFLHGFTLISWGRDPMGVPPLLSDTLDIILFFTGHGERDTVIIRREVSSGIGHGRSINSNSARNTSQSAAGGEGISELLLSGRLFCQSHARKKAGTHIIMRFSEGKTRRVLRNTTGDTYHE